MTSFCVFGIKHSDCVAQARKMVPSFIGGRLGVDKTEFTIAQWSTYCDLLADHIFSDAKRVKQISAAFDAPQFAHDWIACAKMGGQIRHSKIMAKGQKIDSKGAPMVRKGKPVIEWMPYEPTAQQPRM
jgi:hypothetical protein